MIPMSSSSTHNTSRRRSAVTNPPRRRPLARSNSSLLGTIKNIVTAPLTWFATTEDFEDSPDLKGKRRRYAPPALGDAAGDSEGAPRSKRARVKSPDSQIQFHPEPNYTAPAFSQPPSGYLDPPGSAFNNHHNFYRSSSITAPTLNQFNPSIHSGLSRTMSVDPPHNSIPVSRDASMNFTPLDRDTSMEPSSFIRTSSSIPRDHSMPLPPARSFRMRTSLTPQPAQPRETSEPPPLSSLAQRPVFVRQPADSHQRLSSQSSSSTLGSLVESQRSTRSPMRQHSSLLFGSSSQSQSAEPQSTRQPAPAERALHELDIYKTPLLPTRSRLRSSASSPPDTSLPSNVSKSVDPSDMFRPRRSSQLLLMRDDRRASGSGRKNSYTFLDGEEAKEKEGKPKKAKVNETKPYAGEGGMKKLLARRMKEVQEDEDEDTESSRSKETTGDSDESKIESSGPLPPPPPPLSDWQKTVSSRPASSGSSLRVGRTKTSRTHIARPGRPSKKFSAVYEEDNDEFMDDGEDLERQKERQELEETAKKLPAFEVPVGFSFAKESNVQPVEHDANAKEPPISALPFSFGNPSVPAERVAPLSIPTPAPEVLPQPKPLSSAFSFDRGAEVGSSADSDKRTEPEMSSSAVRAVPNFFASSKLLSQAPAVSAPSVMPSFGASTPNPLGTLVTDAALTPKPSSSMMFPSTPAPAPLSTPTATPIKDTENPFWEGDSNKKSSGPQPSLFSVPLHGDSQPKVDSASTPSIFGGLNSVSSQPVSIFGAAKKDETTTPSTSKLSTTGGFSFNVSSGAVASASPAKPLGSSGDEGQTKPNMFPPMAASASAEPAVPATTGFSFGQSAPAPVAVAPSASNMFGVPAPTSNPFTSSTAPEAVKPAFGGFTFGQPKEPSKSTPATSSPFAFGGTTNTPAADSAKPPGASSFTFGTSSASTPISSTGFSFGTNVAAAETKPTSPGGGMFSFGTPTVIAPSARPVTPPRNDMQEFRMEESPTRDMQVNSEIKPAEPRSTLGGGFSFGTPSSGSFGQAPAAPAHAPFSFGGSPSQHPFAAAPAPTENKPFGGGDFGRSASTSNPFAFSQNTASNLTIDPPRPSTTGSFSFGSSTPTTSTGFSFGGGGNPPATANPFASSSSGSAPNSPSTFNQPFSFGGNIQQPSGSFSFGSSQPASPAPATSNLPQPTTPGGFGGGGFGGQPSSPFGAGGIAPPQQNAGGNLFTIGAPPPPMAAGNAPRVLKKLPRRKNA
ncbi:hypothetical protein C8R43DRAFT_1046164 [Mycena crocata]|nr:hypothetical protein C8R43DRAFT_1046164 [Mycena crocata]